MMKSGFHSLSPPNPKKKKKICQYFNPIPIIFSWTCKILTRKTPQIDSCIPWFVRKHLAKAELEIPDPCQICIRHSSVQSRHGTQSEGGNEKENDKSCQFQKAPRFPNLFLISRYGIFLSSLRHIFFCVMAFHKSTSRSCHPTYSCRPQIEIALVE